MKQRNLHRDLKTLSQIARYVLHYKGRLVLTVVCSVIISILSVVLLTLLKPSVEAIFERPPEAAGKLGSLLTPVYSLIDAYSQDKPLITLAIVCVSVLIVTALNGIFRYTQEYMVRWIGNRVIMDMQRNLYSRMTQFHCAYFSGKKIGSLLSYFTVDIRVIGNTIFYVFGRLLLDPCILLVTIGFLLYLQWKLTLIYMLIFPFIFVTMRYYARKNRRAGRRAQSIIANLGAFLQEHFSHIRLVQGYNMYEHQRKRFWNETRGVFSATMSMVKATAASSPINEFLGIFALCCVLLLGGFMIFYGGDNTAFSGEDFIVYIAALAAIYQPVKRLERTIQEIQLGIAATERVFDVMETDAFLEERPNAIDKRDFQRDIVFDNVSFTYDGTEYVLQDVSLKVNKGEQIAFVGPSGAGKTTLINLIPRFFDPTTGRLMMDGYDFRDIQVDSLRALISYVAQDIMIFGDTVWMNITCGETGYTQDQVIRAAKAAYAHEFITALPKGYDTMVGERGESLSGGQCQRIAIARAFLRDTPILIFDEATSSLDSESERHIQRSMEQLMEGRTTFVIAHRLSTVLQSDKIAVLERGRLVDVGPHTELLQGCALYQRLYKLQFDPASSVEIHPTNP